MMDITKRLLGVLVLFANVDDEHMKTNMTYNPKPLPTSFPNIYAT
jgi:hypothetical protein